MRRNLSGWPVLLALTAVSMVAGCPKNGDGPAWQLPGTGSSGSDKDEFTILLYVERNPERHVEFAKDFKRIAQEQTGWEGLFIVHKDGYSELYWGRFPSHEEARDNLKKAKDYKTPVGIALFAQAMIVPLPGKPFGPPEWNILNARTARFSVLVGVFHDVPEANYMGRKQFAVDYCRQLRRQGLAAYYLHGPSRSHVCIGAFGASAVKPIRDRPRGKVREIKYDPRIEAIMKRFPFLAINGRKLSRVVTTQSGERKKLPVKTYAFWIPHKKQADGTDSPPGDGDAEPR